MHTPVPHHGAHRNLELHPGHTRDQSWPIEFKLVFDPEALRVCVKMALRTHPLHNYCRVMLEILVTVTSIVVMLGYSG